MNKYLLLFSVLLIGAFLRFFYLDKYPVQLNHDEVSQLYDLKSIIQTGKDIYGNKYPLAFPSTGDLKPGHYIYISIPAYLLFKDQEITIRIPSAFFGTLNILASFLLIYQLTKNFNLALFSALMVALTPAEIFYSRKSFESIIGEFFVLCGLFLFARFINWKNSLWFLVPSLFFAVAMYIYTAYTIIVSLIFGLLFFCFKKHKKILISLFLWLIFLMPLIYLILNYPEVGFRAKSVFITQDKNLNEQLSLNSSNLFKLKTYIDFIFIRYLNQLNPIPIFINGLGLTNQGFLSQGPLMLVQLPFFIIGILYLILKKELISAAKLLIGLVWIAFIPSAITFEQYSPHRSILAFTTLSIISGVGLYWFCNKLKAVKANQKIKLVSYGLVIFLFIINLLYFIHLYAINYPYEKSQHLHYPFKQISLYAWQNYHQYDSIVIDPKYGEDGPVTSVATHYYLAYYGNYPPEKFQKEYKMNSNEMKFDKFVIRSIFWNEDKNLKKTLIIASPWSLPENFDKSRVIKTFNFYDGAKAYYAIGP